MKGTILVIDDEKAICSYLRCVFDLAGYSVETAHNGRDGLVLARTHRFTAIITDMIMPQLDGIGMITSLRAEGNEVPVVAITAYAPFEIKLDAANSQGIHQVINKPFTAAQIRRAVEGAIHSAARREQRTPAENGRPYFPFRNQGL